MKVFYGALAVARGLIRSPCSWLVATATVSYCLVGLSRQQNVLTAACDLGIFDQAVHGWAVRGFPEVPIKGPGFHHWGDHFMPLFALLGGRRRAIVTDNTVGIETPEVMAERAAGFKARGFAAIKVKLGTDLATDLERMRAIRAAVGPAFPLRIDANQGWSRTVARAALAALPQFSPELVEQPVVPTTCTLPALAASAANATVAPGTVKSMMPSALSMSGAASAVSLTPLAPMPASSPASLPRSGEPAPSTAPASTRPLVSAMAFTSVRPMRPPAPAARRPVAANGGRRPHFRRHRDQPVFARSSLHPLAD